MVQSRAPKEVGIRSNKKKAEWAYTRRAKTCDDGTSYGQEALSGGDWGCDPVLDRSDAPSVQTQRPGALPARGYAGSRTAAREESRTTYGCGERNRPGGEARGLTWQRSGRRCPSLPPTLESPGSRAHHTERPTTFTTAELRENALVLRRRFGLGWNADLAAVSIGEHGDNIPLGGKPGTGRRPSRREQMTAETAGGGAKGRIKN
ncbi:hypothetical protein NDU88_003860 [Pleurodeles waltl]|uniref:Uncharacterized protein n=1 Tax=Pleurodeles waltl TaxID=8319 RepID=A0AAV7SH53_PLEWA|nr:hypothetical protein NDU88_003860 [Pleurodeles waltl]